jgi:hypothetical protein
MLKSLFNQTHAACYSVYFTVLVNALFFEVHIDMYHALCITLQNLINVFVRFKTNLIGIQADFFELKIRIIIVEFIQFVFHITKVVQ